MIFNVSIGAENSQDYFTCFLKPLLIGSNLELSIPAISVAVEEVGFNLPFGQSGQLERKKLSA